MAHLVKDTTGEIEEGSIYLPQAKSVAIGKPVVGVAIAALKEELAEVYGDRFEVTEGQAAPESEPEAIAVAEPEPEPEAAPTPEAKPPRRKSFSENKPAE